MGLFENKVLTGVRAGVAMVPAPVRRVMRSKTATLLCVVAGGALSAYGNGDADGGQAIAGAAIGVGLVVLQRVPINKLLGMAVGALGRK